MKYCEQGKIYKSKSNTNVVDLVHMEATSYGWWRYMTKVGGRVFFNDTNYSATTAKHQKEALELLGNTPIIVMNHTTESLRDLPKALKDNILNIHVEISSLRAEIAAPRSHARKNKTREALITILEGELEFFEHMVPSFLSQSYNYVDVPF